MIPGYVVLYPYHKDLSTVFWLSFTFWLVLCCFSYLTGLKLHVLLHPSSATLNKHFYKQRFSSTLRVTVKRKAYP